MKKTFFVELVFNNKNKLMDHTKFPGGIILAENQEEAAKICLDHYRPFYKGGEHGEFRVQCNWEVHVPNRDVIEHHWKKASLTNMPIAVREPNVNGKILGYRYFHPDTDKKSVMENWDNCQTTWADPAVYYDPVRAGYVVAIHTYMCMPCEILFFKGNTHRAYKRATNFVKENTFRDTVYRELSL